ncbi:MAG: ATP-dependent DNA helicase [Candidatus Nanopelagicales bacterium]
MTSPDPGPALARVVAAMGGAERPAQQRMAAEVAEAIAAEEVLFVQAGTGTGKSVGYLVPAVQAVQSAGATVVIATATLALQRQLVSRDLPAVVRGLDADVSFTVLKGRGNYICQARLAGADDDPGVELDLGLAGSRLEKQASGLRTWADETETGDRDDYPDEVDDRVWRSLSATGRECVGAARCTFAADCFSERARELANDADIIVTNHALLALDAMDDNPVVPEHDVLIIDEGHEFAARATTAATAELSVRMAERAARAARPLLTQDAAERLDEAVETLSGALAAFDEQVRPMPRELIEPLAVLRDACHLALSSLSKDEDSAVRHRAASGLEEIHEVAGRLISGSAGDVTWLSTFPGVSLHVAPLSVADQVGDYLTARDATIMTSATLTLGGEFTGPAGDLGLAAGTWRGVDVGSPFDYARQAILYVATDLPRPGRGGVDPALLTRIRELVAAAGGRTMILLSSWRAVDAVAEELIARPVVPGVQVHVQRRGEPVARLVDEFADDDTSVLVGTMSLFQGVDVPGASCLCVIIDRIPFPRPDEPVLAARSERVEAAGGNGFVTVSVPRAALLLAQGSGRLIRTPADRGVVAVLDPRLVTAGYGSYLRKSLPPMWATTDAAVATAALARLREAADGEDDPTA